MLGMVRNRSCRRCGGNLAVERDKYGSYIACIQCGGIDRELPKREVTRNSSRLKEKVASGHSRVSAGFVYYDG